MLIWVNLTFYQSKNRTILLIKVCFLKFQGSDGNVTKKWQMCVIKRGVTSNSSEDHNEIYATAEVCAQ